MRIPHLLLPILVIAALFGGFVLRNTFTQPTTSVALNDGMGATLTCTVDGLKCKGTANFFTGLYEGTPGIIGIETFATEHRAVFTYDSSVIKPDHIRAIMEAPIPFEDGSRQQVFTCLSLE